jgi:ATP-dependent protease ClpP protease subunit
MAIYDTIRLMPYHVKIINYTHARSMSSLIFLAGDEKLMMPHSYFMFHMGTWGSEGTVKQVKSQWEFDKRTDEQMLDIYVEALKAKGKFKKKSITSIRNMLKEMMDETEEVYLTAQEAVEWGFADGIVESL